MPIGIARSCAALCVLGAWLFGALSLSPAEEPQPTVKTEDLTAAELAIDLDTFAGQREQVEAVVAADSARGCSRADVLAIYGRTSAASGQFERSAAAYAMFLKEFGATHSYSERIAMRLIDSLAPLDLDNIQIVHAADGPQYRPAWRMGKETSSARLKQAVAACEYAAAITTTERDRGKALLRLGWIQRALGDWRASTAAWDRCASEARGQKVAAHGLWMAAENLAWTEQPAAAAERIQRFIREYPNDGRVRSAKARLATLQAVARRGPEWLNDPVGSLRTEIEQRKEDREAGDVYRSVIRWLQRRHETAAVLAVSRWGVTQSDWPLTHRVAAGWDLVDTLLAQADVPEAGKFEAADVLEQLMELEPSEMGKVNATLRLCGVLKGLAQFERAEAALLRMEEKATEPVVRKPLLMAERIQLLLDSGRRGAADALFEEFSASYPHHHRTEEFRKVFRSANGEEK
ncbi:MAG: tetratricopeptide repeat protein [Gemmatimonadota bacterium]|nr:MAG: tetratricopeptide repeat protein [Gemmatimonadota bacterium]